MYYKTRMNITRFVFCGSARKRNRADERPAFAALVAISAALQLVAAENLVRSPLLHTLPSCTLPAAARGLFQPPMYHRCCGIELPENTLKGALTHRSTISLQVCDGARAFLMTHCADTTDAKSKVSPASPYVRVKSRRLRRGLPR